MSNDIQYVPFKKLDARAIAPKRNHASDAGCDLFAIEDVIIPSLFSLAINYLKSVLWGGRVKPIDSILATKVKTGIAFQIPVGMYGLILDRSSMGSKLIKGLAGVIDADYRGDVTVCLMNLSFHDYEVKAGDKVAQIVFHKCELLEPIESPNLDDTQRGDKGFGQSSGK